jgi:hypothetical protein
VCALRAASRWRVWGGGPPAPPARGGPPPPPPPRRRHCLSQPANGGPGECIWQVRKKTHNKNCWRATSNSHYEPFCVSQFANCERQCLRRPGRCPVPPSVWVPTARINRAQLQLPNRRVQGRQGPGGCGQSPHAIKLASTKLEVLEGDSIICQAGIFRLSLKKKEFGKGDIHEHRKTGLRAMRT